MTRRRRSGRIAPGHDQRDTASHAVSSGPHGGPGHLWTAREEFKERPRVTDVHLHGRARDQGPPGAHLDRVADTVVMSKVPIAAR